MHEQTILDRILGGLDIQNCDVRNISLVADKETLRNRLEGDIRQGIRTEDVIERSMSRLPFYRNLDTVKIDTSGKTISEIAGEIITCSHF